MASWNDIWNKGSSGQQLSPEELAAIQGLPQRPAGIPVVGSGAMPGVGSMPGANPMQSGFSWGDVGGAIGGGIKSVGSWLGKNPDAILGALAFLEGQKANKRSGELSEAAIQAQQQRMAMSKDAAANLRTMRDGRRTAVMPQDQGNPYTIRRVGRGA